MSDRSLPLSASGPSQPPVVETRILLAQRPDGAEDIWSVLVSLATTLQPTEWCLDVLAPDHPPRTAALRTVGRRTTVEVPGGTQALQRLECVPVEYSGHEVLVPIPNLLGALLLKADATRLHDPDRHLLDVAFLTSLVTDPLGMRGQLTGSDPRRLRSADGHLSEADHRAWRSLGRERQRAAYATWRLLVDGT